MSSLKEKERAKEQQEKFQAILSALLKDEDNKYCVDCDAKGPRWASWNLGIFLCIRCAGIHRNLGVHISKVKSVNLDTWTAEQVAMVQEIGNSRGRAVYEANIPDGFRRPQSDSALEAFIRSKYEQKKYIAREWVPPKPTVPKEWLEDPKAEKKRARSSKPASAVQIPNVGKIASKPTVTPPVDSTRPAQGTKPEVKPQPKPNAASNDLLGLDLGAPQTHTQQATPPVQPSGGNELLDLFGGPQPSQPQGNPPPAAPASGNDLMNGTSSEGNLFVEEKAAAGEEKKASTKDSIMALFGGGGGGGGGGGASQPQMYGVPDTNAPNSHAAMTNGANDLMKKQDAPNMAPPRDFVQPTINPNMAFSQSQFMMQPSYSQSGVVMSAAANQQIPLNQSSFNTMPNQHPQYSQSAASFGTPSKLLISGSGPPTSQHPAFSQSQVKQTNQKSVPASNSHQTLAVFGHLTSPTRGQNVPTKTLTMSQPSGFAQAMPQNTAWGYYNQMQPGYFGNQGGVYMPQGQQMYPNMPGQQQGMMGPQGMMGQPQGMMGQPQGMMGQQGMMGHNPGMGMVGQQGAMRPQQSMMGQPQGMMGNPAMNGQQAAMYNGQQGMGANPGMYTPQQMQQLQFQQMQQQMTALNVSGAQMGSMPQQATPNTSGWGNPGAGQTLSTNLWQ